MTNFLFWLKVNLMALKLQYFKQELITILKEKEDKYEKMKENVRNGSEKLEQKQENMMVDSVN